MSDWKLKRVVLDREYEVAEVPDLLDLGAKRRLMIRPRKVVLHQIPDTNTVRYAAVEGQQVRRDGELAGSKLILAGMATDRWRDYCPPPPWLNEILAAEGLEWAAA